jgi:hypothetical protein
VSQGALVSWQFVLQARSRCDRYGQRRQRENDYREKVAADIADLRRRSLNQGDGEIRSTEPEKRA